ncbi:hypothetical protein BG005_010876 [Podila minutissima]|nr:hypothetical protein BG005_010876 [Podila minutissima]
MAGKLWIPKIRNDAGIDLLLAPKVLFQVTVSSDHPIKGTPFSKLIGSLVQAGWIGRPEEARLIFKNTPQFDDVTAGEPTPWCVSTLLVPLNERRMIILSWVEITTELDSTDDVSCL